MISDADPDLAVPPDSDVAQTAREEAAAPRPSGAPGPPMLLNIQVLRGLAALLVVFVHLQDLAQLGGARPDIFLWGNTGVDLFFVISGLIMVQTTSRRPTGPLGFLRNRLVRVAPLYWLVTLAVFVLAMVAPGLLQHTDADPLLLLKSLLFVPYARADGTFRPIVFLGWTLNYEMAFYVLFALGLTLPSRILRRGLPIVFLAAVVAAGAIFRPADALAQFYTAPIVLEFAGGMILGAGLLRWVEDRRKGQVALAAAAIALAAMLCGPSLAPNVDRAVIAGIPAMIIVGGCLIAERAGFVLRLPFLQTVGNASYSIYLTHFFVTSLVTKLAARFHLDAPAPLAAAMLAALVLVIAVGIATHVWIELPLTRFFRQGFTGAPLRSSVKA